MDDQISIEKVYETIGRLYLQLLSAHENRNILLQRISGLSDQNDALQKAFNNAQFNNTVPMPVGEAFKKLEEHGVKVNEQTK